MIKTIIGGEAGEYGKDLMKKKFYSDNNLPLNKTMKVHNLRIIVRFVSEEDGKYYPEMFLDECLHEV